MFNNEDSDYQHDFIGVARILMAAKGDMVSATGIAEQKYTRDSVRNILQKTVAAGSLSDANWAGNLAPYVWAVDGFLESLRSLSVFDRLLVGGMRRVPLRTRLGVSTSTIIGDIVGEGSPKPVGTLSLSAPTLPLIKATAMVVMTAELLLQSAPGSYELFGNELKNGVAAATDRKFLGDIMAGAPGGNSSGSTAAAVLADVRTLLDLVATTGNSRLYLIGDPSTANALSTKAGTDGLQAFPTMTPNGGTLCGVPFLVTDCMPADSSGSRLVLIDAQSIAGNSDTITLRASDQTAIQMDDNPSAGGQNMVSMFQTDSRALLAERWFGYESARAGGVAVLSNVSY